MNTTKKIPVRFYRTEAGRAPVLDWLRGLDNDDRRAFGLDLMGCSSAGRLGGRWWEASKMVFGKYARRFRAKRIARVILCFHDQMLVVLHAFIKKTQKTPADDLALAKRRMKEVTK